MKTTIEEDRKKEKEKNEEGKSTNETSQNGNNGRMKETTKITKDITNITRNEGRQGQGLTNTQMSTNLEARRLGRAAEAGSPSKWSSSGERVNTKEPRDRERPTLKLCIRWKVRTLLGTGFREEEEEKGRGKEGRKKEKKDKKGRREKRKGGVRRGKDRKDKD